MERNRNDDPRSWSRAAYHAALVFTCMTLVGIVAGEARASMDAIHIRDDAGGGDCALIGIWDPANRTCTMTRDTGAMIFIESDFVTLDGAGHRMTGTYDGVHGSEGAGDAVTLTGRRGVTVKDLIISRHNYAVNLEYSSGCTVTGIRAFENAHAAVSLTDADNNRITGNRIINDSIDTGICVGFDSDGNELSGNSISGTQRAVFIHTYCDANRVSGNILTGNDWAVTMFDRDSDNEIFANTINDNDYGLYLLGGSVGNTFLNNDISRNNVGLKLKTADDNTFQGNSFVGNLIQAESGYGHGNRFSLPLPAGGNYWDDFDNPEEGCFHDGSGYCDAPYGFDGGEDELPLAAPARPLCERPRLSLGESTSHWSSFNDYRDRRLTVDVVLENQGGDDAYGVFIVDAKASGHVTPAGLSQLTPDALNKGDSESLRLQYIVPEGVERFTIQLSATAADTCGRQWAYPD